TYYLPGAVDRPTVQPLAFLCSVLSLQPRFDVLHWRCDKTDRCTGHNPGDAMTETRMEIQARPAPTRRVDFRIRKDVFKKQSPVQGERTKHAVTVSDILSIR